MSSDTYAFQAEISQLMGLIINTFYSNKEIFLRELISNGSDALDKIRYMSLTNPEVLATEPELKIQIIPRPNEKELIVRDTGVGMTKNDLINCLGTIARSGTKQFMEAIEAGGDISLIGQFGVGFYSAFLVADTVEVYSKHNDDSCHVWSSSAGGSFTISEADRPDLKRGTEIHLHLKDGCEEFTRESRIREIIKTHSQFIDFPIELLVEKTVTEEVEEEEPEEPEEKKEGEDKDEVGKDSESEEDGEKVKEASEDDDEEKKEDGDKKKKKTKKVERKEETFERVNTQVAIWCRKPGTVSHEEYVEFYKHLTNDWQEHLAVKHFHVEGHVDFKGILFIPKQAPFDMFENKKKKISIKLMVRKVFITDECTDLLPEWLSFVKGVVDSDDLPLNISRETLQKSHVIENMKKVIVKKVIELITEMLEGKYKEGTEEELKKKEEEEEKEKKDEDDEELKSEEKWKTFYQQYSKNLKLGIHEDSDNREKLASFLRYYSTKSVDDMTSLDDYIDRMKEHQKSIYYISGESRKACETSPFLEALKQKDFEVLFMDQAIDEYCISTLREYKEHKIVCISKDNLELEETDEEKKEREGDAAKCGKLISLVKDILGDKVEAVKLGYRLVSSPCVLTTSEFGWSAQMQRIMKSQALRDDSMTSFMMGKATLEINPRNKIIRALVRKLEDIPDSGDAAANEELRSAVTLIYETALISSGFSVEDVSEYSTKVFNMIALGVCEDGDEIVEEPKPEAKASSEDMEEKKDEEADLEEVD